jgi:serine phosphatase RsbU (regulator of sigma subunit)
LRPFSLEELSGLSSEQAVASRFDESNFRVAKWVLVVLTLPVAIGAIMAAVEDVSKLPLLILHLLFNVGFFSALRRHRLALAADEGVDRGLEWCRRLLVTHPRGGIVTMLVVQLLSGLLATLDTDALIPMTVIPGFLVLAFRLRAAERIAIHGSLALSLVLLAVAGVPLGGEAEESSGTVPAVLANHAFPLLVGLVTSRRVRREILASFAAAQANAEDQLRMRRELDYAREIQLAMLPADCPPQGWLDICSHSCPATEVGGDYYDYFPLADGRFAVVVGDVAGHGMASGLLLAGVRSCLTLLVEELAQPLTVLAKLNRMVQQTARRRLLVSLAIAVFDPQRRTLTVANAGHPPVLLSRAGGVDEIDLASLPLGTQLEPRFEQREIALEPGDVLLLHSDGLYESIDSAGEPFGFARLAATLARAGGGAAANRDQILSDLAAFQNGAPQRDDLTFVVVRVEERGEAGGEWSRGPAQPSPIVAAPA